MQKPTTEILKRIFENSSRHKDGVYTRLYRYLLREDIYLISYQKLSKNKGALTKGIDTDTADGFGQEYVKTIMKELSNNKFTPKSVRREYIKKANGKMRPLGIPSFKDKLVQEVVRNFLEAIYEPIFSTNSHGFRPKRSCHTALKQASNHFKGTRWFIEGDIKGCFDNINHEKLIEILERKIKDSKFINLIRKFLKAGYMENWKYHQTHSGTPQGGILSPILANIYLNELDKEVEKIKKSFDKKSDRIYTKEYQALTTQKHKLVKKLHLAKPEEKSNLLKEIKEVQKRILKTPAKQQTDKKLSYVRYADDFLIAVNGNKKDCENIKKELRQFLETELKLTLSEEKTLITHSSKKVRFLGYNLNVRRNSQVKTDSLGRKTRAWSGTVNLSVPFEKIEKSMFDKGIIKQKEAKKFHPIHRRGWLYLPDYEIVERYNAEIRGVLNYYYLASDFYKLDYFVYLMEYSCYATLAGKYNKSISKIIKKYRSGKNFVVKYKTPSGKTAEKRILKFKDYKHSENVYDMDWKVNYKWTSKVTGTLIARLQGQVCELCDCKDDVNYEVHRIPSVQKLSEDTFWQRVMKKKNRNTLVVCKSCHEKIHKEKNEIR